MTSLFETMEHSPYRAWCQTCCWREEKHILILTGYGLHRFPCDKCGNVSELATVKLTTI